MTPVTVIGAGLAGCECAWQLARSSNGYPFFNQLSGTST